MNRPSSSDLNIIICDPADSLDSLRYNKLLLAPKISFKASPSIYIPFLSLNMSSDSSYDINNISLLELNSDANIKIPNHEYKLDESDSSVNLKSDDNYVINDKGVANIHYNKQSNGKTIKSVLSKVANNMSLCKRKKIIIS